MIWLLLDELLQQRACLCPPAGVSGGKSL